MSGRPLELVEHLPKVNVRLDPAERDLLLTLETGIAVAPVVGRSGRYDLRPGSKIGAIALPDRDVVILPKIPIDRVLFMISYALNGARWHRAPVTLEREDDLVEMVIRAFTHEIRRAFARGVLQGYVTAEEALQAVRGRIRMDDQIRRRYGIAPPIEVRFDEFTEDILENQLIRAAIVRLDRLPVRSDHLRWPLRAVESQLEGVGLHEFDDKRLPSPTYTRLNERYRGAVELARLILAGSSIELAHGAVRAASFLIDMNQVFEDFLVTALRESLGFDERTLVQGGKGRQLHLDVARRIVLRPDISIWRGDRCRFVADAKYKKLEQGEFKHADLYQLTAYTIATALPGGMLIYAKGEAEPAVHEVVHLGKRLEIVGLDLAGPPEAILAQVDVVAGRIRAELGQAA
jgi:5-methylcytosine-specific restriction enzyme subunit McrC